MLPSHYHKSLKFFPGQKEIWAKMTLIPQSNSTEKKKIEALAIKRQEQLVKAITLSPKTENKNLDLYNPLAVKHQ